MPPSPGNRDPLELLAEQFADRCRRGENPSVFEYAAEHPDYAEQIEALFPAVAMMEQLGRQHRGEREAAVRQRGFANPPDHVGDFDVIREIGRGGMGIVYEAEQRSLRRRVAVKVLPKHALLLERHLQRFQREAQTAARLHHTNIVPVFGVGEQDGLHYYVMPLVRGVGLDEVLRELRRDGVDRENQPPGAAGDGTGVPDPFDVVRGLLPSNGSQPAGGGRATDGAAGRRRPNRFRTVAEIGRRAAEALDYAHTQGVLHRDIKPGNLLVDGQGVVHVADFGLASAVETAERSVSGEIVGTPRYMAPEQLRGAADARTDVYALGLTLYELLTLRAAFEPSDIRGGADDRHEGREPRPPRKIDPAIPRDLETVVLKCLVHEPSRRYQTAAALAADLKRFLEDRPIRARRISPIGRAWRWCRRNPALAGVSALAAGLLVAVVATAVSSQVRTRTAYVETKAALARAEATSQVALEALEDIYLQLSPDRLWISSDSDPGGEACACIGLRSGASPSSVERRLSQVQPSEKTAALLENLLVFYDRLAEQVSDDRRVVLESAIASRRVGDIRQRLGQVGHAEAEYRRALEKLRPLTAAPGASVAAVAESARCLNEIGNLCSSGFEPERAYQAHREALDLLQSIEDGVEKGGRASEECRYELARTYYFLGSKPRGPSNMGSRGKPGENPRLPAAPPYQGKEYRKSAIEILEQLAAEHPEAPDYRFLLALCHRPLGMVPEPARGTAGSRGRQRALRLLEGLKREYPQVADYRYELAATYAWVHVGLFPWQGRSTALSRAEDGLCRALDESAWLVQHNPTIPHFARSRALVLAKLGAICSQTGRAAEAEDYFERALREQSRLVAEFPGVPAHDRVLVEFLRLRLGEICRQLGDEPAEAETRKRCREMLETSAANLARLVALPELADDRLATTSLEAARAALKTDRSTRQ